jgi:hypothetical protein
MMKVRYYLDPDTGEPHIYGHGVTEEEVEHILRHPGEDLPGRDDSRQALGQTAAGRYLRVIYVPDPEPDSLRNHGLRIAWQAATSVPAAAQEKKMSEQKFPPGWDAERVNRVLGHYENLSEEEQVAEDEEAAREQSGQVVVTVPEDLLPAIRQLLANH